MNDDAGHEVCDVNSIKVQSDGAISKSINFRTCLVLTDLQVHFWGSLRVPLKELVKVCPLSIRAKDM